MNTQRPSTDPPTFEGVLRAAEVLATELPPTPAWEYGTLNALLGSRVLVKHENTQPTGAFKVRGGLTLLAALKAAGNLPAGLVTASTGNHAQSVAYAGRHHGIPVTVVMPTSAPANKVEAVQALGAEVVIHGPSMTEAVAHGLEVADAKAALFVDPGGNPEIIHGHATVYLELLRKAPDLEAIYVPIGSGTGAAGACIVRDVLAPGCRIVGVQSAQAPAAYNSWRAGEIVTAPNETTASGLATGVGFPLPQRILRDRLDDFVLIDDEALDSARRVLAVHAHTLAEGAGAAALAAAMVDPARPGRCAIVVSGGNADERELTTLAAASVVDQLTS